MIHTLHREQFIPASIDRVWDYFATPHNLNEMTPPDMAFEFILGGDQPMYAGQTIAYKVSILPGVRVRWLTQITHVEPGHMFIDEQRVGPYRLWIHEHRFEPLPGGVRMTDHVTYVLPFGPLGGFVHTLYIRKRLDDIFNYRREKVKSLFSSTPDTFISAEKEQNYAESSYKHNRS